MKEDRSELHTIVEELIQLIDHERQDWVETRNLNPHFEQLSEEHWRVREASYWVYGSTDYSEVAELEQWLYHPPIATRRQSSKARPHYRRWANYLLEDGLLADFHAHHLSRPKGTQSLGDYIVGLAHSIEEHGWGTKKSKRALNSFLAFLRDTKSPKQVAFIEHIFPKAKDLRSSRIIRKPPPQTRRISIQLAADIIRELAHQCAYGRKNARHHAGEALALVWLCLIASRIRLPRSLESVHRIPARALTAREGNPELLVPSRSFLVS